MYTVNFVTKMLVNSMNTNSNIMKINIWILLYPLNNFNYLTKINFF